MRLLGRGSRADICCKGKRIASPQRDPAACQRALCSLSLWRSLCCLQSLGEQAKESGSEGTGGGGGWWTLLALCQSASHSCIRASCRCSILHDRGCVWFPKEAGTKGPTGQTCRSLTAVPCTVHMHTFLPTEKSECPLERTTTLQALRKFWIPSIIFVLPKYLPKSGYSIHSEERNE